MDTPDTVSSPEVDDERAELTLTVRLSGQTAKRVRRAAAIQQRPREEIAAECIQDEMSRGHQDPLYAGAEQYATTLDDLARRLALIVRDLGVLPSGAAAQTGARAQAATSGPLPPEWHERMIEQLASLWEGRTTEYGQRADGSVGPLEDTKVEVMVTPAQWDVLGRIGAPDALRNGAERAMEAGIAALDR